MKVNDQFINPNNAEHSFEWVNLNWDSTTFSIRNRYDNILTGKFNHISSSEISWDNFRSMIEKSIERKHVITQDTSVILKKIADNI
ncbi:hypothetical protein [Kaistella antarctica]|uniref:Uncharacterized protein n=1 Tax=Kaistella antarctica TaxID=266748 RepID=A0A3S4UVH1_9FLAO|nr:hypothetical protein [Kaistella antarctica]KEY20332.1 hypothetical protein HY04_03785 [Kaistella antarctica]SEV90878.1 hypothetical protein SAMN05421765_1013 [Kaistella antarctica]VEI01541.1 Uncharacterised protein [Kaistella antarctica]